MIGNKLIKEQAGFRPGKSCTGQIFNLTQFIETGYEEKKITVIIFIDNLEWPVWRTINKLRVGIGRSKENQAKWGFIPDKDRYCDCRQTHTMAHLMNRPSCPTSCTMDDIMSATEEGIEVPKFWQEMISNTTPNIIILRYQTRLTPNWVFIYFYYFIYLFIYSYIFIYVIDSFLLILIYFYYFYTRLVDSR